MALHVPDPPRHAVQFARYAISLPFAMGLTDLFSDFLSTMTFTEARAEAPADDDDAAADQPDEASDEGSKADDAGDAEGGEEGAGEDDDEAGGDEAAEEEEEEEEDEPVDPKPRLEEGTFICICSWIVS